MSKLVKCKACGAEIAKSAKSCPQCGAKQKLGCLGTTLGVIALLFGLMLIVAALGGNDQPTAAPFGDSDSNVSGTVGSSDETTETPNDGVFGVGERVEMDDIYVTLNSVTENSGSEYNMPTEGNVFIICEFTVENESNTEVAISSMLSFTAYADDYAVNNSLGGLLESDVQQLDGSIAVGKKMNGVVAFEAPADWSEFEVHFAPNIYSAKEFVFVYSK